ncbi:hypothetical protein Q9Q54_07250 [Campylobacter upsaliensis]|nr:hypothetical protein [Campylobacter upsaliensis]
MPLTFKGSGTSLCGQALSDSVLVLCMDNFKEIKANGHFIWCECGVKQNSYQTIKSVRIILNDGFILDTSKEESLKEFQSSRKSLKNGLLALREELMQDPFLFKEIKRKFAIKIPQAMG